MLAKHPLRLSRDMGDGANGGGSVKSRAAAVIHYGGREKSRNAGVSSGEQSAENRNAAG